MGCCCLARPSVNLYIFRGGLPTAHIKGLYTRIINQLQDLVICSQQLAILLARFQSGRHN